MPNSDSPGITVRWSSFVVDTTPRCMWGVDLREQNQRFLDGIDPKFFNYVADVHTTALEGPERKHAALAIRLAYAQALETLFALLCAAVQAPNCPLGWLLTYTNRDIKSVVRKITEGAPVLSRNVTRPVTWRSLSRDIHAFTHKDRREDERIKDLFADTWEALAADFVDRLAGDEYNSIKHGFRVTPGGSSLIIREPAPSTDPPILESHSEFGTRFFRVEGLSPKGTNFFAPNAMRNWTPVALAVRMELIAVSIINIVSYLQLTYGTSRESVDFRWPVETEALDLAWKADYKVESGQGGYTITARHINPMLESEILASYGNAGAADEDTGDERRDG
jgi:hypothetical protein